MRKSTTKEDERRDHILQRLLSTSGFTAVEAVEDFTDAGLISNRLSPSSKHSTFRHDITMLRKKGYDIIFDNITKRYRLSINPIESRNWRYRHIQRSITETRNHHGYLQNEANRFPGALSSAIIECINTSLAAAEASLKLAQVHTVTDIEAPAEGTTTHAPVKRRRVIRSQPS